MDLFCIGTRVPAVAAAIAVACSGCATQTLYDDDHRFEDGWRHGIVEVVAPAAAIKLDGVRDCRGGAPNDQQFVVVWYRSNHVMRGLILPLDAGQDPKRGTWVLARPDTCSPPVMATP
jgi:hypothetical protein